MKKVVMMFFKGGKMLWYICISGFRYDWVCMGDYMVWYCFLWYWKCFICLWDNKVYWVGVGVVLGYC